MFVYWAFIAKVTARNLLKILVSPSLHRSTCPLYIRRLHAIAISSSLLGVETMQALPVGLVFPVFHSAFKPPEECVKQWPIFNCIEL